MSNGRYKALCVLLWTLALTAIEMNMGFFAAIILMVLFWVAGSYVGKLESQLKYHNQATIPPEQKS